MTGMLGRESESAPFQIRADRDGFVLSLDSGVPLHRVLESLRAKIQASKRFFGRCRMALDLTSHSFDPEDLRAIQTVLWDAGEIELSEVRISERSRSFFDWVSGLLGVPLAFRSETPVRRETFSDSTEKEDGRVPMVVRQTCRSGTRIESPAELIVLGDVNPGAEIIAAGDIIIFGILRGVAHAGAEGDRTAKIWALHIEPQQLRIANVVALPPRGKKPKPKRYEVAEIKGERIEVVSF